MERSQQPWLPLLSTAGTGVIKAVAALCTCSILTRGELLLYFSKYQNIWTKVPPLVRPNSDKQVISGVG